MVHYAAVLVMAALSCFCCGMASAEEEETTMTHLVMLQFILEGEDPYEFASYAVDFAETVEEILSKGYEFDDVNAVVLGVGKTDCGVSVIAVIEYSKNGSYDQDMDLEDMIQYIIDALENNRNLFRGKFNLKDIKSVEAEIENIKEANKKHYSTGLVVGAVAGIVTIIGIGALIVAGMVVYIIKSRKGLEKIPLLTDESEKTWLKFAGNPKKAPAVAEKF